MNALENLKSVKSGDVLVIERRHDLGLTLKSRNPVLIPCKNRRQQLDRYASPQAGIASLIDLTHSAGAEPDFDLIVSEGSSQHAVYCAYRKALLKSLRCFCVG